MSKRSGDFVTLREVVEEVGPSAVRFMMLFRKADAPLDFDFETVTEQSKDNPVFYVQYAHARTASVRRQAAEAMPGLALDADGAGDSRLPASQRRRRARPDPRHGGLAACPGGGGAASGAAPGGILPPRSCQRLPCALEQG